MSATRIAAGVLALAGAAVVLALRSGGGAGEGVELHVYKTASCGCCAKWVDHMEAAGFSVTVEDVVDMREVKRRARVPLDLASCHTALVDGVVIEGHVPARVARAFLEERSDLAGIAVPGMPIGSPGMEGPNPQAYDVIAFDRAGNRGVFERVRP